MVLGAFQDEDFNMKGPISVTFILNFYYYFTHFIVIGSVDGACCLSTWSFQHEGAISVTFTSNFILYFTHFIVTGGLDGAFQHEDFNMKGLSW